jgi:hypothetical protein
MNKNDGRFAAIFLAIAVPVGFWLGMEYLNQPVATAPASVSPAPLARDGSSLRLPSESPSEHPQAEEVPAPQQSVLLAAEPAPGGLYKCQHNGRTAYTDKPGQQCDNAGQATRMAPAVASAGIAPDKPYQQQLAELEQAQAKERALTVSDQGNQAQRNAERAAHDQLCRNLADEIRWLDSALRQPHDAHMGDFWTEKRRNATDRRYSEHC